MKITLIALALLLLSGCASEDYERVTFQIEFCEKVLKGEPKFKEGIYGIIVVCMLGDKFIEE